MKVVVVPTTTGIPLILSSSLQYYCGFYPHFRGNTTIIDPHYHGNYHSYHGITVVPNPMSLFILETHLQCGGVYNNHIIANCLQSVPVKKFLKWSIIGKDMGKSKVPRFLWTILYVGILVFRSSG